MSSLKKLRSQSEPEKLRSQSEPDLGGYPSKRLRGDSISSVVESKPEHVSLDSAELMKVSSYRFRRYMFPSPAPNPLRLLYDDDDDDEDDSDFDDDDEDEAFGLWRNKKYFGDAPKYPDDMKDVHVISKGEHVDIVAFLSNKKNNRDFLITKITKKGVHVPVDSLKGKYVLLCSVFLPYMNTGSWSNYSRSVVNLAFDLSKVNSNFVMVFAVKIRQAWSDLESDQAVFHHFFSGFPDNSLAIPYQDSESSDSVCKSLGLTYASQPLKFCILDPSQIVLQNSLSLIDNYGAAAFPFTDAHIDKLRMEDEKLMLRLDVSYRAEWRDYRKSFPDLLSPGPVSLKELLECDFLSPIDIGDVKKGSNQVPLSDFSDKVVVLYLCYTGEFMDDLIEIHRQCLDQGKKFEIVLVCLPVEGDDPSSVLKHIKRALQQRKTPLSSWWTFPFNDRVCRRIWRFHCCDVVDKLIILPPPGGDKYQSGELDGIPVMQSYGSAGYPFTRQAILERKLQPLKSLTLESLSLKEVNLLGKKEKIDVSNLQEKQVLLFLARNEISADKKSQSLYNLLLNQHSKIQMDYPDSEVVICSLRDFAPSEDQLSGIKFLLDCCESSSTVVAFGKDGHVRSMVAQQYFGKHFGVFEDNLQRELVSDVSAHIRDYLHL